MEYTLKRGETLENVSARFKLPVCMLIRANGENAFGKMGITLKIPDISICSTCSETEISYKMVDYAVKSDDTICSIALKHNTTIDEIIKENGIECSLGIPEGTVLKIPCADEMYFVYTAAMNDSVASIAEKHGISADRLRALNKMTERDAIYAGRQMFVPKNQ